MRQLLVNGAHYILGYRGPDCDLRRWGLQGAAAGKNAKKRAIVGVARRLAILLHHLWITGRSIDLAVKPRCRHSEGLLSRVPGRLRTMTRGFGEPAIKIAAPSVNTYPSRHPVRQVRARVRMEVGQQQRAATTLALTELAFSWKSSCHYERGPEGAVLPLNLATFTLAVLWIGEVDPARRRLADVSTERRVSRPGRGRVKYRMSRWVEAAAAVTDVGALAPGSACYIES